MARVFKFVGSLTLVLLLIPNILPVQADTATITVPIIGLPIVDIGPLLTFIVRLIFIIAGLAALIYALLGALAWITSGGDKEEIQKARDKIQAAIVGIFILILVLTILWSLETIVFQRAICFGISCDIRIPSLQGGGGASGGRSSGGGSSGGGSSGGGRSSPGTHLTCQNLRCASAPCPGGATTCRNDCTLNPECQPLSCDDFCRRFETDRNFKSGTCAFDVSSDPTDCPDPYRERGLPDNPDMHFLCRRGGVNGQCCCLE